VGNVHAHISATCLLIFLAGSLRAQSGPISAGSIATGEGGTVSYTIGQVAFMTAVGSAGSLMEGLQQPYIIESITGIEENSFNLGYAVYPNPTVDYILLKSNVDKVNGENIVYTLYNFEGQAIDKREVHEEITLIPMNMYRPATYFLKVISGGTNLKSFRIIKN